MTAPEFSRSMRLVDLLAGPDTIRLAATGTECSALARRFGIEAISRFRVVVRASELCEGAVRLEGTVNAEVVVAGEADGPPLEFVVGEEFEEIVATPAAIRVMGARNPDQAEDAEPAPGGVIDLGELAAQQLSLALDPVTLEAGRFEDGTLACSTGDGDPGADTPFAALRALNPQGPPAR